MPSEVYRVVASAARYWFLFLGILIVLRSFSWLRKDGRARAKRVKRLPDAGYVGELVVLAGSDELPVGTVLPLPREGVLGSLRSCDVVVPVSGVLSKHVAFTFKTGRGLLVEPFYKGELTANGETLLGRGKPIEMYHGSRLTVGEAVLRMRLFVGVDAMRPVPHRGFSFGEPEWAGVHRQQALKWQTDRFEPIRDEYVQYDDENDYGEYLEYDAYDEEETFDEDEAPLDEAWDERGPY